MAYKFFFITPFSFFITPFSFFKTPFYSISTPKFFFQKFLFITPNSFFITPFYSISTPKFFFQKFLFRLLLIFLSITFIACPESNEDLQMLEIYRGMNKEIWQATYGTAIPESYLAAIISLESYPSRNRNSKRFEKHIYNSLLDLKYRGKKFGGLTQNQVKNISDENLKLYATSFGLTQMMGFHCLKIGCKLEELVGPYQLQWAVVWMEKNYGNFANKGLLPHCFRMHNTGRPHGRTHRFDYVEVGLRRMKYYNKWLEREGKVFYN